MVLAVCGLVFAAPVNPARAITGSNILNDNHTLYSGASLISPDGEYKLVMQSSDGNLVLYSEPQGHPLWSSNTQDPGAYAVMKGGLLEIIDKYEGTVVRSFGKSGNPGAFLEVQDDGNVVIYPASGAALWSTGTTYGLWSVPTPSWWKGTCDSGYNSTFHSIGSFRGLIACGPGGSIRPEANDPGSPINAWEWQCVELSTRWLRQEWGIPQQFGDGHNLVDNYWNGYLQSRVSTYHIQRETPSTAGRRLSPGDVVQFASVKYSPSGHTDVVIDVSGLNEATGNGKITTLNENAPGTEQLAVANWHFSFPGFYGYLMPATAWLHHS
jgi:hypothetical protein